MTARPDPEKHPGPPMDRLGQLIQQGREAAEYLWREPEDSATRQKVGDLLAEIQLEATEQGKHEMLPICKSVSPSLNAAPTTQAVEFLMEGFEELRRCWLAGRQGLV